MKNTFHHTITTRRSGKILVLVAISLPALMAVVGVFTNSMTGFKASLDLQHVSDAAALAAAKVIRDNEGTVAAAAQSVLADHHLASTVACVVTRPPTTGPYASNPNYVEVTLTSSRATMFSRFMSHGSTVNYCVRSVAGVEKETTDVALHILDKNPAQLSVLGISGLLPSLPALLGGLEVLGLGSVRVDGSVIVNTKWSGEDEHGEKVGEYGNLPLLQHAVSCTPLLALTRFRADQIWVTGGVDRKENYGPCNGDDHPLIANQCPIDDPFEDLPVPTSSVDPTNINSTYRGSVTVVSLPILLPPVVLRPGIYDSINIVAGRVRFEPGIYIIRSTNLLVGAGLVIAAGQVEANGVMFYITDSASYNPSSGSPDSNDANVDPHDPGALSVLPSVVINAAVLNSSYTGLNDPSSPFHGMLIYQRRHDRRPIVILKQDLLLSDSTFEGTIYSKWGHVILSGQGQFNTAIAAGSVRILTVTQTSISPSRKLPAARNITLVE